MRSSVAIEKHKGVEISFDPERSQFDAEIRGEKYSAKTIEDLRSKIDRSIVSDFKRFEIILLNRGGYDDDETAISVKTVTSITPRGEVWLTTKGGSREKLDRWGNEKALVLNTPRNQTIAKQIISLRRQIKTLEKDIEKEKNSFECFDKDLYVKDTYGEKD